MGLARAVYRSTALHKGSETSDLALFSLSAVLAQAVASPAGGHMFTHAGEQVSALERFRCRAGHHAPQLLEFGRARSTRASPGGKTHTGVRGTGKHSTFRQGGGECLPELLALFFLRLLPLRLQVLLPSRDSGRQVPTLGQDIRQPSRNAYRNRSHRQSPPKSRGPPPQQSLRSPPTHQHQCRLILLSRRCPLPHPRGVACRPLPHTTTISFG